jgi:hypothetical protein
MRPSVARLSLLGVVAFLASGCSRLPKTISDFPGTSHEIKSVTVMPVSFTLEEAVPFGARDVRDEITREIEAEIKAALEQLVTESRYGLVRLNVPGDAPAAGLASPGVLGRDSVAIAAAVEKIGHARGKSIDVDWPVGPDTLAGSPLASCRLFVLGNGYFTSLGSAVKSALLVGFTGVHTERSGFSNTSLFAYLVDARRGKVLWFNREIWDNKDPRKPSHVMKTCQRLMAPLLGKSRIEPDASRDEVIIGKLKGP